MRDYFGKPIACLLALNFARCNEARQLLQAVDHATVPEVAGGVQLSLEMTAPMGLRGHDARGFNYLTPVRPMLPPEFLDIANQNTDLRQLLVEFWLIGWESLRDTGKMIGPTVTRRLPYSLQRIINVPQRMLVGQGSPRLKDLLDTEDALPELLQRLDHRIVHSLELEGDAKRVRSATGISLDKSFEDVLHHSREPHLPLQQLNQEALYVHLWLRSGGIYCQPCIERYRTVGYS